VVVAIIFGVIAAFFAYKTYKKTLAHETGAGNNTTDSHNTTGSHNTTNIYNIGSINLQGISEEKNVSIEMLRAILVAMEEKELAEAGPGKVESILRAKADASLFAGQRSNQAPITCSFAKSSSTLHSLSLCLP
jgi:hypothetical protein